MIGCLAAYMLDQLDPPREMRMQAYFGLLVAAGLGLIAGTQWHRPKGRIVLFGIVGLFFGSVALPLAFSGNVRDKTIFVLE